MGRSVKKSAKSVSLPVNLINRSVRSNCTYSYTYIHTIHTHSYSTHALISNRITYPTLLNWVTRARLLRFHCQTPPILRATLLTFLPRNLPCPCLLFLPSPPYHLHSDDLAVIAMSISNFFPPNNQMIYSTLGFRLSAAHLVT